MFIHQPLNSKPRRRGGCGALIADPTSFPLVTSPGRLLLPCSDLITDAVRTLVLMERLIGALYCYISLSSWRVHKDKSRCDRVAPLPEEISSAAATQERTVIVACATYQPSRLKYCHKRSCERNDKTSPSPPIPVWACCCCCCCCLCNNASVRVGMISPSIADWRRWRRRRFRWKEWKSLIYLFHRVDCYY